MSASLCIKVILTNFSNLFLCVLSYCPIKPVYIHAPKREVKALTKRMYCQVFPFPANCTRNLPKWLNYKLLFCTRRVLSRKIWTFNWNVDYLIFIITLNTFTSRRLVQITTSSTKLYVLNQWKLWFIFLLCLLHSEKTNILAHKAFCFSQLHLMLEQNYFSYPYLGQNSISQIHIVHFEVMILAPWWNNVLHISILNIAQSLKNADCISASFLWKPSFCRTSYRSVEKAPRLSFPNKLSRTLTLGNVSSNITLPLKTIEILDSKIFSLSNTKYAPSFNIRWTWHLSESAFSKYNFATTSLGFCQT